MAKKNNRKLKLAPFSMSARSLKDAIRANSKPHEFFASGQYTPDMMDQFNLDPRYRAFISKATK